MAVADANYKFIYIDVGSYGKDSDSTIFRNSLLWKNLERNNLNIPASSQIPGINIPLPYAFVGDEAFSLSKHLLRPPIDVKVDFAVDIVKCCCVLHNFVRDRDGFSIDDTLIINGFEEFDIFDNSGTNRNTSLFRDALSYYFMSDEGKLQW
ncbi:protein ALP1-like, partial [Aphis craccivora]